MNRAADPPRPPAGGDPALPTMSVVVPTRNRVATLPATLAPLLADEATTELVAVDDGSSDHTPTVLTDLAEEDPRVRPLRLEGRGAAGARQAGAEAATGEVVLFIDDDVVADDGLVTGHARRQAEAEGAVVVGYMPTQLPDPRRPGQFATVLYQREYEGHCRRWEADPDLVLETLWAGNVSLPRDRCLEVGLASSDLAVSYHEDRDLGLRLRAAGLSAVFDRSLRGTHAHSRSLEAFTADAYKQGVDRYLLAQAYPEGARTVAPEPPHQHGRGLGGLLVRAADRPGVGRVVQAAARRTITVAGRLRRWPIETAAAQLLRQVEQRRGFHEAQRGGAVTSTVR